MQVVNVHVCRSRRSQSSRPLFENRLITVGIIAEVLVILAIDYTTVGNAVFGTADRIQRMAVRPSFGAAMLTLEEGQGDCPLA